MRKNTTNTETENKEFTIKEGTKVYGESKNKQCIRVGLSAKGYLYASLNDGKDNLDFIGGFEAINFLNELLAEISEISVHYEKATSRGGRDYEKATPVNYIIPKEEN